MTTVHTEFTSLKAVKTAFDETMKVDRTLVPDAPEYQDGDLFEIKREDHPLPAYIAVHDGKLVMLRVNGYTDNRLGIPVISGYERGEAKLGYLFNHVREINESRERAEAEKLLKAKIAQVKANIKAAIGERATIDENGRLLIDGHFPAGLEINERDRKISGWRREGTGKIAVLIREPAYHGARGRLNHTTHRFSERKDGSLKYDEIAVVMIRMADRAKAARQMQAVRTKNAALFGADKAKFFEDLGLSFLTYYHVEPSADPEKPLHVKYTIQKNLTIDELKTLDAAFAATGLFNKA